MNPPDLRRAASAAGLLITAALAATLTGCASMHRLSAEVSSFGDWPAGRAPTAATTYAFERLPSQQAQAGASQQLEDAAGPALAQAGFQPVAAGAEPDVVVQLAARVDRTDLAPWDDPFWWSGGLGYGYGPWRHGHWRGAFWHAGYYRGAAWGGRTWGGFMPYETPRYEREVAVLIRDRASGKPLYEARASNEGFMRNPAPLLSPLFAAALTGFPAIGPNPRRVTVALPAE